MSQRGSQGEATGVGWPSEGAFDPDGPGPLPRPDGVDVGERRPDVSRETQLGAPSGIGWAAEEGDA